MYVCFLPFIFRIYSFLIISASFDSRTLHTHARACIHCSIAFAFFSSQRLRVCVPRDIFFSLFRNWPSDLLLSFFLPTLVYNAVLSSSSSVCHCDLFLLYFLSHTLMFHFWRSFVLSRFHAFSHSIQASVFSPSRSLSLSFAAHY